MCSKYANHSRLNTQHKLGGGEGGGAYMTTQQGREFSL